MNTESWLNAATEKIRFAPDREAVKKELRDHLEDRRDALLARGLAAEEAETQATAAMGDPAELAQELGRLHSPWWGYIWRASQWGLLCVVFLIFGLATNDIAPAFEPIDEVHQYLIYSGTDFFGEPRILERTVYTPTKRSSPVTMSSTPTPPLWTASALRRGTPFRSCTWTSPSAPSSRAILWPYTAPSPR